MYTAILIVLSFVKPYEISYLQELHPQLFLQEKKGGGPFIFCIIYA